MSYYNLIDEHKQLAKWLVKQYRAGELGAQFTLFWLQAPPYPARLSVIDDKGVRSEDVPDFVTRTGLDVLESEMFIKCIRQTQTVVTKRPIKEGGHGISHRAEIREEREVGRICTFRERLFFAIDSKFGELSRGESGVPPGRQGAAVVDLMKLKSLIENHYNIESLKDLCLDMEVDYESLGDSNNKGEKVREFVLYAHRFNLVLDLLLRVCRKHPDAHWDQFYRRKRY